MTSREQSHLQDFNILEFLGSFMRYSKIRKYIPEDSLLLDVGCGYNANLLHSVEHSIKHGYGIDFSVNKDKSTDKIDLIECNLDEDLFPSFLLSTFDVVTCLAVAEHLNNPVILIKNIYNVLKESGMLILTVPTWKAKSVLEFLAFKLRVASTTEIADHKRYYNKNETLSLCKSQNFSSIKHTYFQFGWNNLVIAIK